MLTLDKFFIVLILTCLQFKWLRSDISSILFPFNTAIDQNPENKNSERNLSLRNRYQPDYPSAARDQYSVSNNLLNKLSDKANLKNSKVDRPLVVPDLYCEKEEWLCHDKLRCIPRAQICNTVQNCIDNSDELNCENQCRGDEFKCANNKCISDKWRCDSIDDCGDMSDETNCIGTGKILALPKLTGNLKVDLDNFENIENQNLFFSSTEHSSISSKTDNHPNKHPDTFNKQINLNLKPNDQLNGPGSNLDNNQIHNLATNQASNQANQISAPSSINQATSSTTPDPITESDVGAGQVDKANKTVTNYEAPYVKIFPLTPVIKNTESMTPNRVAYNNYAILTNKLVNNSTGLDKNNKSLIESLGFEVNKSTEKPETASKTTTKPGNGKPASSTTGNVRNGQLGGGQQNGAQSQSAGQNAAGQNAPNQNAPNQNAANQNAQRGNTPTALPSGSAQALNGQELANEKKNQLNGAKKNENQANEQNRNQADQQRHQQANRTAASSIDVSSKSNRPALAFSISLPKTTEPSTTKQEGKKGKGKDNDFKKINCRRPDKRNTTECLHCSYGLFRCSMGKCVITSFECGSNMTNTTRGRRIAVNVNDFLQFV